MSEAERPIDLDEYVKLIGTEPNFWWTLSLGNHLNLLDEALERLDEQATEIERLRVHVKYLEQFVRHFFEVASDVGGKHD